MNIFVQFPEAYIKFVEKLCVELKRQLPGDLKIYGIATRRKTVCKMVDALAAKLGTVEYDWWSSVEQDILDRPYNPDRLAYYRTLFSDRELRHLISCDREIGYGYVTGGTYARTKLRSYVESSDEVRWQYVVGVLDYFLKLFSEKKPAFVFLNEVTFTWELAAYMIARHLQIPCLVPCYTRAGQKFIITDNPFQKCSDIENLYQQALNDPALVESHMQEAEALLKGFRQRPEYPDYTVRELKLLVRQASVPGMLKQLVVDFLKLMALWLKLYGTKGCLRQEYWWDVLVRNVRTFSVTRKAIKGVLFEAAAPYLESDYIYYPLHLEPESATLMQSEHFTNQLAFIEQISKNMPAGYKLLVKEHIPAMGVRPIGFYDRIRSLPDVHLLTPFDDSFELIKHAQLVCVLAGTVGWEAMMLGIPLLVIGTAQFMGIKEGFVRCKNLFTLDDCIKHSMNAAPIPEQRLVLFIAATLQLQGDLKIRDMLYWHYGLDPDEVISVQGVEQLAAQVLEKAGLVNVRNQASDPRAGSVKEDG